MFRVLGVCLLLLAVVTTCGCKAVMTGQNLTWAYGLEADDQKGAGANVVSPQTPLLAQDGNSLAAGSPSRFNSIGVLGLASTHPNPDLPGPSEALIKVESESELAVGIFGALSRFAVTLDVSCSLFPDSKSDIGFHVVVSDGARVVHDYFEQFRFEVNATDPNMLDVYNSAGLIGLTPNPTVGWRPQPNPLKGPTFWLPPGRAYEVEIIVESNNHAEFAGLLVGRVEVTID